MRSALNPSPARTAFINRGWRDHTLQNGIWSHLPSFPFEISTLQAFDSHVSSNQHICYFKSQNGDVVSNNSIMAHLFIGTLKWVTIEWFLKLPKGSIKNWGNLERLFHAQFLEDDLEVTMLTLLVIKQQREEPKGLRRAILDCCTLVLEMHDPVNFCANITTQLSNPNPSTNGVRGMSHIEEAGETWRTRWSDTSQGSSWREIFPSRQERCLGH